MLFRSRNILILGDPGTGKTHGLGYEVEKRLDEGCPAILIRAKGAPVSSGWGAMIRQALGLSGSWGEDEIWSALEACAARSDRTRALSTGQEGLILNELTRVLICVDGLDEAGDRNSWLERIGELKPIMEKKKQESISLNCNDLKHCKENEKTTELSINFHIGYYLMISQYPETV